MKVVFFYPALVIIIELTNVLLILPTFTHARDGPFSWWGRCLAEVADGLSVTVSRPGGAVASVASS